MLATPVSQRQATPGCAVSTDSPGGTTGAATRSDAKAFTRDRAGFAVARRGPPPRTALRQRPPGSGPLHLGPPAQDHPRLVVPAHPLARTERRPLGPGPSGPHVRRRDDPVALHPRLRLVPGGVPRRGDDGDAGRALDCGGVVEAPPRCRPRPGGAVAGLGNGARGRAGPSQDRIRGGAGGLGVRRGNRGAGTPVRPRMARKLGLPLVSAPLSSAPLSARHRVSPPTIPSPTRGTATPIAS